MHVQGGVGREEAREERGGEEHHLNARRLGPGQAFPVGHTAAKKQCQRFPGLCHRRWCPWDMYLGFLRCRCDCSRPAETESGHDEKQTTVVLDG